MGALQRRSRRKDYPRSWLQELDGFSLCREKGWPTSPNLGCMLVHELHHERETGMGLLHLKLWLPFEGTSRRGSPTARPICVTLLAPNTPTFSPKIPTYGLFNTESCPLVHFLARGPGMHWNSFWPQAWKPGGSETHGWVSNHLNTCLPKRGLLPQLQTQIWAYRES